MNDILRDRLIRKLDTLPEERVYQIFDFIDFLESKYAQRGASQSSSFSGNLNPSAFVRSYSSLPSTGTGLYT